MQNLTLTIRKQPIPKQSFRFANGHGYTPAPVKAYCETVTAQILAQLPDDFQLITVPIEVSIRHIYTYTADAKKIIKKQNANATGTNPLLVKATRPDVTDNLNKGLIDAMQGLIFLDDALIWNFHAVKMFGEAPMSIIEIKITENLVINEKTLFSLSESF